ncbi:MAG TPA: transglycosylase domain-containing protein, partial [Actinomycetes bacterium]|nr:transglycosylase domain-containing protein [Actinomycetes bacterium]
MLVEAVVLDGDDGVADPLGDALERHHPAVLVQPDGGQGGLAVGGVDDRSLRRVGQGLGQRRDENRRVVPLKSIPKRVRNAVIAIEDDRFYQHDGVD